MIRSCATSRGSRGGEEFEQKETKEAKTDAEQKITKDAKLNSSTLCPSCLVFRRFVPFASFVSFCLIMAALNAHMTKRGAVRNRLLLLDYAEPGLLRRKV